MRRHVAVLLVLASLGLAGCAAEPEGVQYPPGQRPCGESIGALDQVLRARASSPSGEDPSGRVRAALEAAKEPLLHRAGESSYYDAAGYNRAADQVAATLDPLIEALDAQEDVPYEVPEYRPAADAYERAEDALLAICDR